MEKLFNNVSLIFGMIAGIVVKAIGGYDDMAKLLICAIILDYLLGVLKAMYLKKLSSQIGYKGIIKKVSVLFIVAVANIISNLIGDDIPIREITIMFFITNECISVLENVAEMDVPIPQKLKDILLQIRNKSDKANDTKDEEGE